VAWPEALARPKSTQDDPGCASAGAWAIEVTNRLEYAGQRSNVANALLRLGLGCTILLLGWGGPIASASPRAFFEGPAADGSGRPLLAVSCSSSRDCTAVGGLFAEHWNGRSWSFQPLSTPPGSDGAFDYLSGVSCASTRLCMAVGSERPSSDMKVDYDYSPLAELSSGSGWSDQSPAPGETPNDYLQAVSCPSSAECIAVGQGVAAVLALGWHDAGWTVQLSPVHAPGMSILEGVSCTSIRRCIAARGGSAPRSGALAIASWWNAGTAVSGRSSAHPSLPPTLP
jgi:hypothetical protein